MCPFGRCEGLNRKGHMAINLYQDGGNTGMPGAGGTIAR
jgi:hypothetical protein